MDKSGDQIDIQVNTTGTASDHAGNMQSVPLRTLSESRALPDIEKMTRFFCDKIQKQDDKFIFKSTGNGTKPTPVSLTDGVASLVKDYFQKRDYDLTLLNVEDMLKYATFERFQWRIILAAYIVSQGGGAPGLLPEKPIFTKTGIDDMFKWLNECTNLNEDEKCLARIFYMDHYITYLHTMYPVTNKEANAGAAKRHKIHFVV
ncbi:hypothetical protein M1397_00835 [Candidatus Marsarchaeota archaeon]|nr:hypothetical protein [Candidatus Marsarchaeota archaeon]